MERKTIMFDTNKAQEKTTKEVLKDVYEALEERGYNGIDQMVGYILSGDPSYITSYNNARMMISRIDRVSKQIIMFRRVLSRRIFLT